MKDADYIPDALASLMYSTAKLKAKVCGSKFHHSTVLKQLQTAFHDSNIPVMTKMGRWMTPRCIRAYARRNNLNPVEILLSMDDGITVDDCEEEDVYVGDEDAMTPPKTKRKYEEIARGY